jgi:peroxiredoxin
MNQLSVGDVLKRNDLVTIRGEHLRIPDPERLVHLQFRRYAGCPICNLHLRSIVRRYDEILAAGIAEVVVFHSSAKTMLEFQGQLPFAAIADPEKKLYAEFGADRSVSSTAMMNPRTWMMAANALARGYMFNHLQGAKGVGEDATGLPSEFLIAQSGRVIAAKYGKRMDDHWSVDDLLDLAGRQPPTAERPVSERPPVSQSR